MIRQPRAAAWKAEHRKPFALFCRQSYAFDPQTDGELVGAERLGASEGAWSDVWTRFAEAPRRYPKLPALLRRANPKPAASVSELFVSHAPNPRFPHDNEALENELRDALRALSTLTPAAAARRIIELEAQHGERRAWVWAELCEAPLALALRFLSTLAETSRQPVSGSTPNEMAKSYTATGWRADEATLDCLPAVKSAEDVKAIHCALRAVYLLWLEQLRAALSSACQNTSAAHKQNVFSDGGETRKRAASSSSPMACAMTQGKNSKPQCPRTTGKSRRDGAGWLCLRSRQLLSLPSRLSRTL
ncbi:MAG: hypothetical protein WKF84_14615 [Pyrinomonadaceae bacterium]